MSKMAEMDMMVQEVVEIVETEGTYLIDAVPRVAKEWGLDAEEIDMVWSEANRRIYW